MLSLYIKPKMSVKIGTDTIEIISVKSRSHALIKNGDAFSAINLNETYLGRTISDENKIVDYTIKFCVKNRIAISAPSSVQIERSNAIKKRRVL